MELKFSFVCAYANVSSAGNLNASEIFTSIGAPQFPCIHPQLMFIARLGFKPNETGNHKFRVLFLGDGGVEIVPPVEGMLQVREPLYMSNLLLNFNNVAFPKPGTYWLDLSIDGKHLSTEELQLIQTARGA